MHKRLHRHLDTFPAILLIIITITLTPFSFPQSASANADPPDIWLPTPVGETWEVIQGFYCGTHDNEREIDFSRSNGSTIGAPVRAAADGVVNFWTASSGTLLIDHGNDYYTEYTHLSDAFSTVPGTPVFQGQEVGHVNGYDHLHFSFYHSPSGSYFSRTTLELDFLDGYSMHDTSGCNQHFGEEFVAKDNPDTTPPTITFETELEADQWYCEDQRIEFTIDDDRQIRGFSQKFNGEPEGEQPEFEGDAGYVQLKWAKEGMHTLSIRAWDRSDNVSTASFGPIGYDATPPTIDEPHTLPEHIYRTGTFSLSWNEANDGDGSGIAGYNYYLGTDPNGTSDQFTDSASVEVPDVAPGCYVLRIQAHDNACGTSDWVTIQNVVVNDRKGTMPAGACDTDNGSTSEKATSEKVDSDDEQSEEQDRDSDTSADDVLPLTELDEGEVEKEETATDESEADSDTSSSDESEVAETETDDTEADDTDETDGEESETDDTETDDTDETDGEESETVEVDANEAVADDTEADEADETDGEESETVEVDANEAVADDTEADDTGVGEADDTEIDEEESEDIDAKADESTDAATTEADDTETTNAEVEETQVEETQVEDAEAQETASASTQESRETDEETQPTESDAPDVSASEQVTDPLPLSTQDLPEQDDVQVMGTP